MPACRCRGWCTIPSSFSPVPRNLNYAYTFGGILTVMLVSQILTGVVLAMHFAPDTLLAFNSVEKIMRDVNSGWLLRYLHSNGASFFFIAVYIHIGRGLYYGSFQGPARTSLGARLHQFIVDDGNSLHGLRSALGTDVVLGRNRHHQLLHRDSGGRPLDTATVIGRISRSTTRPSIASSPCTTCCHSCLPAS